MLVVVLVPVAAVVAAGTLAVGGVGVGDGEAENGGGGGCDRSFSNLWIVLRIRLISLLKPSSLLVSMSLRRLRSPISLLCTQTLESIHKTNT